MTSQAPSPPVSTPRASRPRLPQAYGIPKSKKGLLPWSHVEQRMTEARNYWIGTTGPDGMPHAVPVWGIWLDNCLYFGTSPDTQTGRNLAANPAVAVHLDSSDEVVIIKGFVETKTDPAQMARVNQASTAKYGWPPASTAETGQAPSEGDGGEGTYVLRPTVAFAWNKSLSNATRWRFSEP